jgi:uncharacterized membrane protein YdjX (TVP38/TMEM64 family)
VVEASERVSIGDKVRLASPIVLYAVLAALAWKLGYFHTGEVRAAARGASGSLWAGAGLLLVYAAVSSLALPVSPLAYAAGAIFGFWRAFILVWLGSMLGAVAGFYLARSVLAKPARGLLGRYKEKLRNLKNKKVFLNALRLQLMPIVPFGAFNYAAAIAKLDPLPFFAGTAIGIIPGTLLATFIGDRLAAGAQGGSKMPYLLAAAGVLVVLGLSFAPKLWEKFRKGRRKHTE